MGTSSSNFKFDNIEYEIYESLSRKIIAINEDSLKLKLIEYEKYVQTRRDWISPLASFISILLALLTAEFKDFLGFKGDTWAAVFIIIAAIALIIFVYQIIRLIIHRNHNLDFIIDQIKQESRIQK